MSKATVSKSRAEKAGKVPPAQTPVVSHEIVPGKFNDHDWNMMVDRDGAEDFVDDIVDDLIGITLNKCYELFIQRQLIPFTVSQAKDAILKIVEWRFLKRDEGEKSPETDPGWMQDEEPDPAETDCWAQGSVPKTFLPSQAVEILPEVTEEVAEVEDDGNQMMEEQDNVVVNDEPELEDQVSEPDMTREEELRKAREQEEKAKAEPEKKKRRKFKPYTGKLRPQPNNLTESLEQTEMTLLSAEIAASMPRQLGSLVPIVTMPASCHNILKVQSGRPPGNKDVEYDDYGNVVAVIKLNPEKLPSHRVKVNYQVVDPAVEAAQARLDAMRTGRYVAPKPKRKQTKKDELTDSVKESNSNQLPAKTPLPPPMIETMEVAPGVTIREGGRLKQGPSRYIRRIDMLNQNHKGLKPVMTQSTTPRLSVSELLDRHTPILRPIHDNSPLPPIMAIPHPPEKPKVAT
ncbi:uncharacterized protein LOC127866589 [Dreissena polymorpha]|uniref:Uncharacterized protein n=1 Tax=Dreissena polymorpha TaxID=45954 RepID=A0A9D4RCQ4_DREPO|nr:uncharacterized protein LOC127866589 [Dreissena polymorpha]XP_052263185.1 uncharacterized protein LOC127866589 [Dreissena polymorpha]XP_052263186.1 uncharacterized protein LOC127866589 [Dreissena polymorpha]KAH3863581.1 hypothetical protein DPMN_026570 [Dreissena polymorpha]